MSNNKHSKEVLNILKEQKKKAEEIAESNLIKALTNDDFKQLYQEEKELIFDIAIKDAEGVEYKEESLKLEKIRKKKLSLLKSMGYKLSDLEPDYACKICNDTGIVDGKYCSCYKKELSKLLLKSSKITKFHSFDESDEKLVSKEVKLLHNKMKQWCDNFGNNKTNTIVFSGNTGVGKTFLTSCMSYRLVENGYYVLFTTAFNLNNDLLKYHTTFNNEKENILAPYLDCEVLVIDDLGTEPILKNVTLEYLYLIINERIINNKAIIVSTNLDMCDLKERYGDRIFSRLIKKSNSFAYEFKGEDIRLKKC